MKFIRTIFFPFSILYAWFMSVRNKQFNTGQRTQTQFDRVVISVGNLSMGGTGKTPMIELLIRMLKNEYQVATISRGYGRKTRGFRRANTDDTASTIGDEPFQFFKKFGNEIAVSVCEERILAIPSLLLDDDSLEVFLLDDAFQHRQAGRDLDIMLTDYNHPFYKDYVLPTGNLREPRKGAGRADMIVVTKCPADLKSAEKEEVVQSIRAYNAKADIFFSHIGYLPVVSVFEPSKPMQEIALLTGVAKAQPIADYLEKSYKIMEHLEYPDHYNFRERVLVDIGKKLKALELKTLVTTEKDMVRLLPFREHPIFKTIDLFYLPIEFDIDRLKDFKEQLMKVVENVN